MSDGPRRHSCIRCEQPLYFLQPVCTECEKSHDWQFEAACHTCGEQTEYTAERCTHCDTELSIWRALEADAITTTGDIGIWKEAVPSPLDAGYRVHLGSIHGQWADFRRVVRDGGDFHVRVYRRHYQLHHDRISAVDAPARHMIYHGPEVAATTSLDIAKRVGGTVLRSGKYANDAVRRPYSWIRSGEDTTAEE